MASFLYSNILMPLSTGNFGTYTLKTSKICLGSNPNRGGGGHLGDRNHAVYIPYCDYFATSDKILIQALKSEFEIVMVENNLHLFRIKKEANRK